MNAISKRIRATVVCCYNNEEQLNNELLSSLEGQTEKCEVIRINNVKGAFSSCSKAYNSVLDTIRSDYIIFAHQDIVLEDPEFMKKFIDYLEIMDDKSILGVAGIDLHSKKVITNIYHRRERERVSCEQLVGLNESETIDECFFGGSTKLFRENKFDEAICDGWHLYAVEFCLRIRKNHGHVFTCDLSLFHTSGGYVSFDYCNTFFKLCQYYKKDYKRVITTCSNSKTSFFACLGYIIRRKIIIICRIVKRCVIKGERRE